MEPSTDLSGAEPIIERAMPSIEPPRPLTDEPVAERLSAEPSTELLRAEPIVEPSSAELSNTELSGAEPFCLAIRRRAEHRAAEAFERRPERQAVKRQTVERRAVECRAVRHRADR